MIEIIAVCITLSILFVVSGFAFCFWLVIKHLKHQEILTKSQSIEEYAIHEAIEKTPAPKAASNEPAKADDEADLKDITEVSAEEAFQPR